MKDLHALPDRGSVGAGQRRRLCGTQPAGGRSVTTTYKPQPGTQAFRILAWLEAEGKTAERNSSQIANAMGIDPNGVPTLLAPALAAHLVFRRQKDRTHPRAPFWYSLTDRGVRQRQFTPKPAEWMDPPKAQTLVDAHADSLVDGSAETHESAPAPDTSEGLASQQVLKAEAARPDATAREATSTGSPGVGPMGAWQPADAGPTTDVPVFITEQRREVDAQFAASLRAAMNVDVDDDCLARGAELGRKGDQLPPADLAATRRAVHAPLAFRAARFSDGTLATERDGIVVAVYSAAEVDAIQKLLGARA